VESTASSRRIKPGDSKGTVGPCSYNLLLEVVELSSENAKGIKDDPSLQPAVSMRKPFSLLPLYLILGLRLCFMDYFLTHIVGFLATGKVE